jgi:hypothetical protein
MKEQTPLQKLAHASAKEWFRSRNVPHWSAEYQSTYPIYVSAYIRAAKREEKKLAKSQA